MDVAEIETEYGAEKGDGKHDQSGSTGCRNNRSNCSILTGFRSTGR
jgi:hypothetical protein